MPAADKNDGKLCINKHTKDLLRQVFLLSARTNVCTEMTIAVIHGVDVNKYL